MQKLTIVLLLRSGVVSSYRPAAIGHLSIEREEEEAAAVGQSLPKRPEYCCQGDPIRTGRC